MGADMNGRPIKGGYDNKFDKRQRRIGLFGKIKQAWRARRRKREYAANYVRPRGFVPKDHVTHTPGKGEAFQFGEHAIEVERGACGKLLSDPNKMGAGPNQAAPHGERPTCNRCQTILDSGSTRRYST